MGLLRTFLHKRFPWAVTGVVDHAIAKATKVSIMGLMSAKIVTTILANTGTENGDDVESI